MKENNKKSNFSKLNNQLELADEMSISGDALSRKLSDNFSVEKFIPVFTTSEQLDLVTYHYINKKHATTINDYLMKNLENHPVWAPIINQMSKDMMDEQNAKSSKLQEDAIMKHNWKPYIEDLFQQGVIYARMGVSFKEWLGIVSILRNYLSPIIEREYFTSENERLSVINGMNLFIDFAIGIIGESYVEEKNILLSAVKEKEIAEKEQATKKIRKLSEFQEIILNGTDYSIISANMQGTITSFNKGAEKLLGYTAEELVGKSDPSVFHDLEEIKSRAVIVSQELNTNIEPGFEVFVAKSRVMAADTNEWTYIRKDSLRITVELSVTALR